MMRLDCKAQGATETLLALAIVIALVTVVGLIAKSLFAQVSPTVGNQTNTVVNRIT